MKLGSAAGLALSGVSLVQAGILDNVLAPSSPADMLGSIVEVNSGASNRVWQMLDRGPVSNIMSNAIACNQPDGSSWPVAATVKAGGSISFDWPGWPTGYKGPSMTYLAYCSNSDCTNQNPNLLDFFKIDEDGLHDDGSWASDSIAAGGAYTIKIPSNIASGSYLMRHEFVNLGGANLLNGAKFYPVCANLKVTGGGTSRPSDTVRFPGAYASLDPGIFLSISDLLGAQSYIFPGPPPISGAVSRPSKSASASARDTNTSTSKVITSKTTGNSFISSSSLSVTLITTPSASATSAVALVPAYGQCGGLTYFGATECISGYICSKSSSFYSQCIPDPNSRSGGFSASASSTSVSGTSTSISSTFTSEPATSSSSHALAAAYAQCGGLTYVGPTKCVPGYYCSKSNEFYSQCILDPNTAVVVTSSSTTSRSSSLAIGPSISTGLSVTIGSTSSSSSSVFPTPTPAAAYAQCGGVGYSGPTNCVAGYWCFKSGDYYSQCIPGTEPSISPTTPTTPTTSKTSTSNSSASPAASTPPATAYAQCGGIGHTGATTCITGYWCSKSSDYYSQCIPGTDPNAPIITTSPTASTFSAVITAVAAAYAQCGGIGYSGPTSCANGYWCSKTNDYYSQCIPGSDPSPFISASTLVSTSISKATASSSSYSSSSKAAGASLSVPTPVIDILSNTSKTPSQSSTSTSTTSASTPLINTATVGGYAQCGGIGYTGGTSCGYGWECVRQDDYYSQCKPAAISVPLSTASVNTATVGGYSQCGGINYSGGTRCEYGWDCVRQDDYYSQCKPATASAPLSTSISSTKLSSPASVSSSTANASSPIPISSSTFSLASVSVNTAIVSGYSQCGGIGYTGGTQCEYGWECVRQDAYYSQCKPAATSILRMTSASTVSINTATVGAYAQCGGINYSGGTRCEYGWECIRQDDYYSQCKPAATSIPKSTSVSTVLVNTATVGAYAQCGGINYSGGTRCEYGWECIRQDDYYSQCKPTVTSIPLTVSTTSVVSRSTSSTAGLGAVLLKEGILSLPTSVSEARSSSTQKIVSTAPASNPSTTVNAGAVSTRQTASVVGGSISSTSVNTATVGPYSQCGGIGYTGGTLCQYGWECVRQDDYYSQCKPAATSMPLPTLTSANPATVGAYSQCGGINYSGGTKCEYGWECIRQDDYYSQCKPVATSTPRQTSISINTAIVAGYSQCGGINYTGGNICPYGWECVRQDDYYSQCRPAATSIPLSTSTVANTATVAGYAQCGGINYNGGTRCPYGWECIRQDDYYSQCKPAATSILSSSSVPIPIASTTSVRLVASSSTAVITPITSTSSTPLASSSSSVSVKLPVNLNIVSGYSQCGGIGYTGGTVCEYGWECIRQDAYYSQCKPAATSTPLSTKAINTAIVGGYDQCGGLTYTGGNYCPYGWECVRQDDYYSQCRPASTSKPLSTSTPTISSTAPINTATVAGYAQCGGNGYTGGTSCPYGWECVRQDEWYSQCKPASASAPTTAATSAKVTSSSTPASSATSSSSSTSSKITTSSPTSTSSFITSSSTRTTSSSTTSSSSSSSSSSPTSTSTRVTTSSSSSSSSMRITTTSTSIGTSTSTSTSSPKSSTSTQSPANTITVAGWAQCGGIGYTGGTNCPYGWECSRSNDWYFQCVPATTSKPLATSTTSTASPINTAVVGAWAQCGGIGYTGGTVCTKGYSCYDMSDWYSQCWPSWLAG